MNLFFRHFFIAITATFIYTTAFAQPARDTTRRPAASQAPRPYKEIITEKAITWSGFFKVHKVDDKYYFEIPDNMLGRDIL
ncbi:MAG TPA: DUF5118 domain-containing protein, partial [Chitinophagaceae bacterium]|nr:DUF5118 domain-containing protein [Chitinophagaceae bacterium]